MRAFAIRHIPTGKFMPCRMYSTSRGGWSYWDPAHDADVYDRNPRLFFTKQGAANALTMWLQGEWKRSSGVHYDFEGSPDYYDEVAPFEPPTPRVRFQMEVVPFDLSEVQA